MMLMLLLMLCSKHLRCSIMEGLYDKCPHLPHLQRPLNSSHYSNNSSHNSNHHL